MKIVCIARNYAAHADEMKSRIPSEPVFFLKPATALLTEPFITYPSFTGELHYETEIVYRISAHASRISRADAANICDAVALGIDFTARDIQRICKEKSLPWEKAKAFDGSAAVGRFIPLHTLHMHRGISFRLEINGRVVQQGDSNEMIFPVDALIEYVSAYITLEPGDLFFTGTPAGVGRLNRGDSLKAFLNAEENLSMRVR